MGLFDLFKKKNSGDVAKDRLKLLLVSDRANCSPDVMELIKNDIINVISKYMIIDTDGLDIQITQTESDSIYVARIRGIGRLRNVSRRPFPVGFTP